MTAIREVRELGPAEVSEQSQRVGSALVQQGEYLLGLGRELLKQSALLRGQPPQAPARQPITAPGADHSVGAAGLVDLDKARTVARDLKRFTRTQLAEALGLKGVQVNKWLAQLLENHLIARAIDEESHATVFDYTRQLEDEDALYQVRCFAQGVGVQFTGEQAIEATELPEEEVAVALTQLAAEGLLTTGRVDKADGLGDVEQLGETTYRYAPPLPPGVAGDLERQRLKQLTDTPAPQRGTPVRIKTERKTARKRSTPGARQKIKNNEREYQRLMEAKDERRRKNQAMAAKNGSRRSQKQK